MLHSTAEDRTQAQVVPLLLTYFFVYCRPALAVLHAKCAAWLLVGACQGAS